MYFTKNFILYTIIQTLTLGHGRVIWLYYETTYSNLAILHQDTVYTKFGILQRKQYKVTFGYKQNRYSSQSTTKKRATLMTLGHSKGLGKLDNKKEAYIHYRTVIA